jgi:type IV pilus assembly protein PilE
MSFSRSGHGGCAGFAVIEILIAATIVAIISAIALPSYTAYIARARRAEARTQLLHAAQFMQRFHAANDGYEKDRIGNHVLDQIPSHLKQSPPHGSGAYALDIPSATLTPSSYVLHMAPNAPGPMARDKCGTFTLTSTGIRGVQVNGATGDAALRDLCWR